MPEQRKNTAKALMKEHTGVFQTKFQSGQHGIVGETEEVASCWVNAGGYRGN